MKQKIGELIEAFKGMSPGRQAALIGGSVLTGGLGAYTANQLFSGNNSQMPYMAVPPPVGQVPPQQVPVPGMSRPPQQINNPSQGAGTGVSMPQPQQPVLSGVDPLNAEEVSRLIDYTGRNLNRDAILYAELTKLQRQLEEQGVA